MDLLRCFVCGDAISPRANHCPGCGDIDPLMFRCAVDRLAAIQLAEQRFESCWNRFEIPGCLWYLIVVPGAAGMAFFFMLREFENWVGLNPAGLSLIGESLAGSVIIWLIMRAVRLRAKDELRATKNVESCCRALDSLEDEIKEKVSADICLWRKALRLRLKEISGSCAALKSKRNTERLYAIYWLEEELVLRDKVSVRLGHPESQIELAYVRIKPAPLFGGRSLLVGYVRNNSRNAMSSLKWRVYGESGARESGIETMTVGAQEFKPFKFAIPVGSGDGNIEVELEGL